MGSGSVQVESGVGQRPAWRANAHMRVPCQQCGHRLDVDMSVENALPFLVSTLPDKLSEIPSVRLIYWGEAQQAAAVLLESLPVDIKKLPPREVTD